MAIIITEEMKRYAIIEAKKRKPYIKHHFNVEHLSSIDRDVIGFLGEFACCEMFGLDWKNNIRDNYLTIDRGDIKSGNLIFDVKTETLPNNYPYRYFHRVFNRLIDDDSPYGRRLIVKGQVELLEKYDIVIFGAFVRDNYDKWYSLGYLETKFILKNYNVTKKTPFGSEYPEPALPIRTSDLKPIGDIKKLIIS